MVYVELAVRDAALQQVSAGAFVIRDEVEVIARYVESPDVVREAKSHEASSHVAELEGRLVFYHLDQGRIRLALPGNAASLRVIEASVHADGIHGCRIGEVTVQVCLSAA